MGDVRPDSLWPLYVINLKTAVARRQVTETVLDRLGLQAIYFEAVDGRAIDSRRLAEVYDAGRNARLYKRPLSLPEIGCYLSHHALWARIADDRPGGAFIFEDDFEAADDLPEVMQRISELTPGPYVVKLARLKRGAQRLLGPLSGRYHLVEPWVSPALTTGYAITREAAGILARATVPISRPVDIDLKHWWEFGITVLATDPCPLRARDPGKADSAIEAARLAIASRKHGGGPGRFLRNAAFQMRFLTGLAGARLRRWRSGSALRPMAAK